MLNCREQQRRTFVFSVLSCPIHQPVCTSYHPLPFPASTCCGLHPDQSDAISLQHVANMMIRMKREFPGSQNSIFPVFDTLLLLDRNVDLLTPLATQLTYEGLIDEIYGIQNSESCGEGMGFLCPGAVAVCWVGLCFTKCDVGAAQLRSMWDLFSPELEPIKIHSGSFCLGRGAKYSLWLLKGIFWVPAQ